MAGPTQIASDRKTSVDHLIQMALKNYTKADRALLADAVTRDVPYTSTK
jgi:hypothetical protein